MKKFNEIKYVRPNIDEFRKKYLKLVEKFKSAQDAKKQIEIFYTLDKLMSEVQDMFVLVSIRHSMDTTNEFYKNENDYVDENMPFLSEINNELLKAVNNSKFKNELKNEFGDQLFSLIEAGLKSFDSKIIPLMQEENKLSTEYTKLIASAKIEFDGKILNLNELTPYTQSKDREIRKNATKKVSEFFYSHIAEFDSIYDKLVQNRDKQAKMLGFENYIELGYLRLNRTDYTAKDVSGYRDQVLKYIVPVYKKLVQRQQKRLKLDKMYFYDKTISFLSGNPTPKGDVNWQVDKASKMYSKMSPETKVFFDTMTEYNLLDLPIRKGKASGGYCTLLNIEKMPFIFANFNGTSHDVTVLTHEAGHAFQIYNSTREQKISQYYWPTYEAAEIHSMSMEFITYPYMNEFFLEDTEKFKFAHLESGIRFVPYGVCVDEFQHFVYENPSVTPKVRREKWIEITKKYGIDLDHDNSYELDEGIFWFRQLHIFSSPLYYIDYTLAQVCAFQFYLSSLENFDEMWQRYVALCKLGGSLPFTKLVESAGLKNPFKDGTISSIMPKLEKILDSFDDFNM